MMKSESNSNRPQLSRRKVFLFKIGAILFALCIIVAFEFALRLVDYGTDYSLVIQDSSDDSKVMINPQVSKKYFSNVSSATSGIPTSFDKKKNPSTTRIFILGASTGIGYPYRYNGGFHNWLDYGLQRSYPSQRFEIINLSLTAVNSYTLLDFTNQLVDYQPDAVLIYTGHNEYYGALGVASTNSLGNNPWLVNVFVKLKTFRMVQLISNSFSRIKNSQKSDTMGNETLMKKMVKDQSIAYDSDVYKEGIHQFESNLAAILKTLDKQQIPTFLSTIVSNIKDVKPFVSDTLNHSMSAKEWFNTGKENYISGNFDGSKKAFIKAKELDMLRFRAPEQMNVIIDSMASNYSNVILVKSYDAFVKKSPQGIIGDELLLEHVHPNVKGYGILGFSFYKALLSSSLIKFQPEHNLNFNEFYDQMPITVLDSVTGNYEILMLKEGWPYYEAIPKVQSDSLSIPEVIAGRLAIQTINWDDASKSLFQHYSENGDDENALKVLEAVALKHRTNATFFEQAGTISAKLGQSQKTAFLYKKAYLIDPSIDLAKRISRNLIENGEFKESLIYLEAIKKQEPDNVFAAQLHTISKKIIDLQANEFRIKTDPSIGIELAENFILIGNTDKASLYLKTVLEFHPSNKKASELLIKISSNGNS